MEFSKEQKNIFNFAEHGIGNMIVQAIAGSGKTTTLIECANRINPKYKVLLLAHNKSTRDTLRERIGDKKNVHIYTLHGLAYRMFTEYFEKEPEIYEDKYRDFVNKNISSIGSDEYQALSKPLKMNYKSNVFELINKARYNLKKSEREIKKLATKKYGMTLIADEAKFVSDVLNWGAENTDTVDFQDLLWFPSQFCYITKKYTADIIMLDEAQDVSIAQQDIISRCFRRETRMFSFGDRSQTINMWAGSDTEAFESLKDSVKFRHPASEFPLTTNYRCGRRIIDFAKQFTDNDIKAYANAPEGSVNYEMHVNDINDNDMVLCRNISPLMDLYRKLVNNGKKVYFRSEELGKNIITQIDSTFGETFEDIVLDLKIKLISNWEMLTKISELDPQETMTNPRILSLLDVIKTIERLPYNLKTRKDIEDFINNMFSNEGHEGIELSTIHRAKGLEADNVFVICPSLLPSRMAETEWQIIEERNLQYVMYTRAKNNINFISENEIAPSMFYSQKNALYSELEKIKKEIDVKTTETI